MPSVFAIYHLPNRKGNSQFLGLSTLYFEVEFKKTKAKIPLNDIAKAIIEKRRKLAPLVLGGVITSLSLLSILLYSSSLEVVGLAAIGLLLTYYGLQEHTVLLIEHSNNTMLIWLPLRISMISVRPFIALLEYYISRQQFPVLYARNSTNLDNRLVHFENKPQPSKGSILYRFGASQTSEHQTVVINPILLDAPIDIYGESPIIATGDFLINKEAVIEENSISYS